MREGTFLEYVVNCDMKRSSVDTNTNTLLSACFTSIYYNILLLWYGSKASRFVPSSFFSPFPRSFLPSILFALLSPFYQIIPLIYFRSSLYSNFCLNILLVSPHLSSSFLLISSHLFPSFHSSISYFSFPVNL